MKSRAAVKRASKEPRSHKVSVGTRTSYTATEAKHEFGRVLEQAIHGATVVITKHDATGGLVTPDTVSAQLLYELGDPERYLTPDVTAKFTSIQLKQDGDMIHVGDMIFRLEGEKATEDIECLESGILRIAADGPKEGDTVRVGHLIAHVVQADADKSTPSPLGGEGRGEGGRPH